MVRLVGTLTDVTDFKTAEERLLHDSVHDNLTGLPNRQLILDRLEATCFVVEGANVTSVLGTYIRKDTPPIASAAKATVVLVQPEVSPHHEFSYIVFADRRTGR